MLRAMNGAGVYTNGADSCRMLVLAGIISVEAGRMGDQTCAKIRVLAL